MPAAPGTIINVATNTESTKKSDLTSLLNLLSDNVTGQISARDLRDAVYTLKDDSIVNPGSDNAGELLRVVSPGVYEWATVAGMGGNINSGTASHLAYYPISGQEIEDLAQVTWNGTQLAVGDGSSSIQKLLVEGRQRITADDGHLRLFEGDAATASLGFYNQIERDGDDFVITAWDGSSQEGFRMLDSGYVGIGGISPTYPLHVNGTASFGNILTDNITGIDLDLTGDLDVIGSFTSGTTSITGDLSLTGNITSDVTILNNVNITGDLTSTGIFIQTGTSSIIGDFDITGNSTITGGLTVDTNTLIVNSSTDRVGIGRTTPSVRLHIGDSTFNNVSTNVPGGASDEVAFVGSSTATSSVSFNLGVADGSRNPRAKFFISDGTTADPTGDKAWGMWHQYSSGAAPFVIGIINELFRINPSGNVGINTQSPTEKLHVVGNIKASVNLIGNNAILSNTMEIESAAPNIKFKETGHAGTPDGAYFQVGPNGSAFSLVWRDPVSVDFIMYVTGTASPRIGLGGVTAPTSAVDLPASDTNRSSLRIRHGSAPSAPNDGDIWTTTAGLYVRINGSTVGPLS